MDFACLHGRNKLCFAGIKLYFIHMTLVEVSRGANHRNEEERNGISGFMYELSGSRRNGTNFVATHAMLKRR